MCPESRVKSSGPIRIEEKIGKLKSERYMLLIKMNGPESDKSNVNDDKPNRVHDHTSMGNSGLARLLVRKELPRCKKSRVNIAESMHAKLLIGRAGSKCKESRTNNGKPSFVLAKANRFDSSCARLWRETEEPK
jgi:hypothetical protein